MTPTKQLIYLQEEERYEIGHNVSWLKPQQGYFFTPEQLNEYTRNVIEKALETAANNAEIKERKVSYSSSSGSEYGYVQSINKKSITNTFEETYKKFEV